MDSSIGKSPNFAAWNYVYLTSLISGGVAGLVVDLTLFPIDTIKTRLQAERGFWRSGGFRGIYNGLVPVIAGSAPTAALFFCTYETMKGILLPHIGKNGQVFVHMTSASVAEVAACLIRVPVEVAKQRRQAFNFNKGNLSALQILLNAYNQEGLIKGVYRGFGSTLAREIPFSLIQFPLWEYFKANWSDVTGYPLLPYSVAICGAMAGGIAAAITTPLDVAKTRIMLADRMLGQKLNVYTVLSTIYRENGLRRCFAGFVPRVLWITIGGAIFLGSYDYVSGVLRKKLQ